MSHPRQSPPTHVHDVVLVLVFACLLVAGALMARSISQLTAQVEVYSQQLTALEQKAERANGLAQAQHDAVEAEMTALSQTIDRTRAAIPPRPKPESTAWLTNRDRELQRRLQALEQWHYRGLP